MLKDTKAPTLSQFLVHFVFARQPGVARRLCDGGQDQHPGEPAEDRPPRGRPALSGDPADEDSRPGDRLHLADRRGADPQGPAPGGAGRVLRRRHAAAGRLSRQSVPDRGRPGLRRRGRRRSASRARRWPNCSKRATPARCGSSSSPPSTAWAPTRPTRSSPKPSVGTRVSPGKLKPADIDQAARGHAERQPQRRPVDERAALRQPRAAAVPGRRLRHHADGDGAPTGGPTA